VKQGQQVAERLLDKLGVDTDDAPAAGVTPRR
jgi:hypothetical protein